ncbi:hypothetical protein CcCBS67573_g03751 [Chytriomyces confervae]|uniref:Ribosome biogenesis protein NOP53 n=1 Tax=Chytriomyces confervae TaxID=246404 RepID=A0A507FF65_9FUNG|nr:hypothetical protein CcCBS67573_g03751 [Chytriomyces confervae]
MSAVDNSALSKKRGGSRKGKKAWKKNVDISQIEDAITQISNEKRLTGSAIVDKANDSLFTIDKKGSEKAKVALKYRKLKIEDILKPQSAVESPPTIGRKNTTVPLEDESKVMPGKKVKVASKAIVERIGKIAKRLAEDKLAGRPPVDPAKSKKRNVTEIAAADLWGSTATEETGDDPNDYLAHLRPKKVKKPSLPDERPTNVPAVKVSHSGSSYNPAFADHQGLLQAALDVELEKERVDQVFKQKLSYPPELDNIDDENFFDSEEEEEEGAEEEKEESEKYVKAANENVRKTRTQRNKEAAKVETAKKQAQLQQEIKLKKQLNHVDLCDRLAEIKKAVDAAPEAKKPKKEKVRKTGPVPLKQMPLEIKLTEELPESLLRLKPEGNLFKDRFQSLQERSLIEPRVPVAKRQRYKNMEKEKERHDYKRFDAATYAKLGL